MPRGGKRAGAGRPKKAAGAKFESAQAYLEAVARGDEEPNALRIQAAKALLPYEAPRARVPVSSAPPKQQEAANAAALERQLMDDWATKAAAVRERMGKTKP